MTEDIAAVRRGNNHMLWSARECGGLDFATLNGISKAKDNDRVLPSGPL